MRFPRIIPFTLATCLFLPIALTDSIAGAQEPAPVPSPATADVKTAALRKQIQTNYDTMNRAFERFDVNASVQYYALDYRNVGKDGNKSDLSDYKETWRTVFRRGLAAKATTEITVFTVKGDTVTVETRKTLYFKGRRDDGTDVYIEVEAQDRDFWMNRKAKWFIKQTRTYDFSMKVNGQLVKE